MKDSSLGYSVVGLTTLVWRRLDVKYSNDDKSAGSYSNRTKTNRTKET